MSTSGALLPRSRSAKVSPGAGNPGSAAVDRQGVWVCSLGTRGTCGGRASAAAHQAPTMWACTGLALVGDPNPGALQRCPASGHGLVQEHVHDARPSPVKAARSRVLTLRRCGELDLGQPLPGQPPEAAMTHATEPGIDDRPG